MLYAIYYIYIRESPADLRISYRENISLKYILERVYCISWILGIGQAWSYKYLFNSMNYVISLNVPLLLSKTKHG